jgi:hypothetical protein
MYIIDGHGAISSGDDQCPVTQELQSGVSTNIHLVMNTTSVYVYYDNVLMCSEVRQDRTPWPGTAMYLRYVPDTWSLVARARAHTHTHTHTHISPDFPATRGTQRPTRRSGT